MDRRVLEYFQAVARTGSLSEAAREMSVTQPALSKQIGRLESQLSMKLFDRTPTGMVLTVAGRELLTLGTDILARFDRAEGAMRARFAGAPAFRVACPATTAYVLVTPFMAGEGAPIADLVILPAADVDTALHHDADLAISTMRPADHRASMLVAQLAITTQAPPDVLADLTSSDGHVHLESFHGTALVPRTGVSVIVTMAIPPTAHEISVREVVTGSVAQAHSANGHGVAMVTEMENFGLRAAKTWTRDGELLCPLYASWETNHYASAELLTLAMDFRRWMASTPPWSRTSGALI